MVYDSIQERIFNDYFEQTSELSNLYSWMIDPGPNEFFINNFVNELSNINNFLDVGGSDYDCNIKDELHSIEYLSNIVKTAGSAFVLQQFNSSDAMHYIPHFPQTLLDEIKSEHKEKLNKIFNIYQLYDHVINNPNDVASGSINVYNFIDQTSIALNSADTTYPENSLSHYDYIIGSDATSIRDKLTPNLLYTCRGIYLVLLYKNIADVYISYYNQCDARMTVIDGTTRYCSSSAIDDINTLIDSFLISSIDKIFLFAHYKLRVTYNSNILTLDDTGTTSSTFFDTLNANNHVIYNINKNKYISIVNNITKSSNSYTLAEGVIEGTIASNFTNGDKCVILPKKSDYASYTYDGAISKLSSANEIFNKNKSEYQKSIGNYNAIQGSFNNIDYIYYLTIIIVIISLIAIVATNSEQSRKTRVFIILIIVLLTYGMIFSFIEVAKRFTENFSITDETTAEISSKTGILNNNFTRYLELIYMESSNYGMTRLYDTLTDASNKEAQNVRNNNKVLESSTNRNDATTNAEWHRLFQRTLFIHTTFLFLILVLTYLWLSIIMPDMNIYLLFITIIASMILIFYYFRNLHRVVRTEYKHRYWTKMSV
tara:strand:- start:1546 stop:3342 length:1797 start_codon:yes stop_codon:yes gene_type:complete